MALFPIRVKRGVEAELLKGFPWIYTSDITQSSEHLLIEPGSLVAIENPKGQRIGTGYFNAKSQIACRVLALGNETIDKAFFVKRIKHALVMREKIIPVPYYRLIHSESDFLPGLLVDRFGDYLVVQAGTAGMEALEPYWLAALKELFNPRAIILRNEAGARKLEGLKQEVRIIGDAPNMPIEVIENDCIYLADLIKGQKTGWFFDQRDNRKMIAADAKGKTLVDIYSHSGGFGLLAAKGGARVTMVDSSVLALDLAKQAAARNDVTCDYRQGDAFEVMQKLYDEGKRFDHVLADPPAFVKTRKDITAGMKGYEKIARLAVQLVAPGGKLFMASCSHHASRGAFNQAVLEGVAKAGFSASILKQTGASADHPRHPLLPQSEYLKGIWLQISGI